MEVYFFLPIQEKAHRAANRSSCAQSASDVLPPAGSSLPLPGAPDRCTSFPTWVEPLQASQDPFSPDLMSYWHALNWSGMGSHLPPGSEIEPTPGTLTRNSNFTDWMSFYGQIGLQSSNAARPSPTRSSSIQTPKFDGADKLCLEDGWVLIKGENAFFLEAACKGLDPSKELLSKCSCSPCTNISCWLFA